MVFLQKSKVPNVSVVDESYKAAFCFEFAHYFIATLPCHSSLGQMFNRAPVLIWRVLVVLLFCLFVCFFHLCVFPFYFWDISPDHFSNFSIELFSTLINISLLSGRKFLSLCLFHFLGMCLFLIFLVCVYPQPYA